MFVNDTSLTSGAVSVEPDTLWFALFVIALVPSPRPAARVLDPARSMVPLLSVSALAPMLMPSASASAETTW